MPLSKKSSFEKNTAYRHSFLNNLSFRSVFAIQTGMTVLIATVFGLFFFDGVIQLSYLNESIYRHPFAVSNAVREVKYQVMTIHQDLEHEVLSHQRLELPRLMDQIDQNEAKVFQELALVKERFLGSAHLIEGVLQHVNEWRPIRTQIIELIRQGEREAAIAVIQHQDMDQVEKIERGLQALLDFANHKADEFQTQNQITVQKIQRTILIFIGLMILLNLGVIFRIYHTLSGQMTQLGIATDEITSGDYSHSIPDLGRNEMGTLAQKFEYMRLAIRNAIQKQAQAQAEAERANQCKSQFLANMSHEIRTPLSAILGMAHLVRREALSQSQKEHIDRLEMAGNHLLDIICAILDLSKIESNKLELEDGQVAIESLIHDIRSMFADSLKKKALEFHTDIAPVPRYLRGDATRLKQMLINYVANAVKFTEKGCISLKVEPIEENETSVLMRFQVQDTGPGIVPDILSKLFSPFEQGDNSLTRQHGGTGLGLIITQKLARLMDGDAGGHSTLGQGCTFWFTARLKKEVNHLAASPSEESFASGDLLKQDYSGTRLLLAEDDEFNREFALLILEEAGFVVDTAADGAIAVQHAQIHDYALILMDMQMPNLNGLEAARQIRLLAHHKQTPIIAMTANAFVEDKNQCFEAGMNDFITKPVPPELLYNLLLKWLSNKPISPSK